jgi:peptidyl-prolyl cis-trans isomerase A (cyclophilin A)
MRHRTLAFCCFAACSIAVTRAAISQDSKKDDAKKSANPVVEMKTSMGSIKIELWADKSPISVKNFLSYVDEKYYDNTVFHRVMDNFMIQGGGFENVDPIKQKKSKGTIKNEATNGLKNDRGTIAMARMSDPDSASSQFFINVVDNAGLNRPQPDGHGYAVFGKVIEGMDTVDKIRKVKTGVAKAVALGPGDVPSEQPFKDVPVTKVVVESVRRVAGK